MIKNIKNVEIFNKNEVKKQVIYIPPEKNKNSIDITIMNNIAKDGYIKFNHIGIIGAEKIKNSNNLWCDTKHNIWQINCGKVRDMNFNEIPNCYYVRIIGTWF